LKEDQRQDEEALRTAVMSLVYRAEEDLPRRETMVTPMVGSIPR
jgi:hypothetical protein